MYGLRQCKSSKHNLRNNSVRKKKRRENILFSFKIIDIKFDYCLVNLYRDGNDYINFHADNEAKDIIASISLGATRRFLVRHLSSLGKKLTRKNKPLTSPETTNVIIPLILFCFNLFI